MTRSSMGTVKSEAQADSSLAAPSPSTHQWPHSREASKHSFLRLAPCPLGQREKLAVQFIDMTFKKDSCFESSYHVVTGLLPGGKNSN